MNLPSLSIIIPTRNDAANLKKLLRAIKHLDNTTLIREVIVVNHRSTDNTGEVARELGAKVIDYGGRTIGGARNEGVKFSSGDIICFLDSDCEPAYDYLNRVVERVEKETAITGSRVLPPPHPSWVEKTWFDAQTEQNAHEANYINSGNLIVPRKIFESVGGFDETLTTGEDYEFCVRARKNFKVISDPSIRVIHHGFPKTLGDFFSREVWHGLGGLSTLQRNPFDKPLIASVSFGLCWSAWLLDVLFNGPSKLSVFISCCGTFIPIAFGAYRKRSLSPKALLFSSILAATYLSARCIALMCLISGRTVDHWKKGGECKKSSALETTHERRHLPEESSPNSTHEDQRS